MDDLRELPRFDDSLGHLYLEHVRIEQHDKAIAFDDGQGLTPVPAASLTSLMLGPGTSITHAAIKALADNNCLVCWVGQDYTRFYAYGAGGTRSSSALLVQARLVSDPTLRLRVVERMYRKRFQDTLPIDLTLEQLRGKEGIRVREAYATASRKSGVAWHGRNYKRGNWQAADPVNRALSTANACLYGVVHAAIVSAGYSPALGFIHTGKQLSFVYDIADLYKADLTIPLAFEAAVNHPSSIEKTTRTLCRERFRVRRLLETIIPDIRDVLNVEGDVVDNADSPMDAEASLPSDLWDPTAGSGANARVEGGVNYGGDDSGTGHPDVAG